MAGTSPAMTMEPISTFENRPSPIHLAESFHPKTFFTIFVDAIFTTLLRWLFTNAFDVIGANAANSCVYRACNAD
jgi:hypothetical protein